MRKPDSFEVLSALVRYSRGAAVPLVCEYLRKRGIQVQRGQMERWISRVIEDGGHDPWLAYLARKRRPRSRSKHSLGRDLLKLLRGFADQRAGFPKERQRWHYWPPFEISFWLMTGVFPPRILMLGGLREETTVLDPEVQALNPERPKEWESWYRRQNGLLADAGARSLDRLQAVPPLAEMMGALGEVALTGPAVVPDDDRLSRTFSERYIERVLNEERYYWRHVHTNTKALIHIDMEDKKWVRGRPRKRRPRRATSREPS